MDALELNLPPHLQDALKERAAAHDRSVEDEARALLALALGQDEAGDNLQLEQLSILSDAQLWQLARRQVPLEKSERMQVLGEQAQAEGLSPYEVEEAERLRAYAHRVMLLRAEAATLLQRRGHEIDDLRVQR